jgi:acyl-CoA hydrolase
MATRVAAAAARMLSAEEAAGLVRPGMWLDYGGTISQPDVFDRALGARAAQLADVKIRACLSMRPRAVLEADPEGRHFCWVNQHFSGYDRRQHDAGRCNYMPLNLGEVPDYYRRFIERVDIVILKTCPLDAQGYFNFGPTSLWHRAIVERAKTVIVEVTRGLPYVYGVDNGVHVSEVDYLIEGDHQPAPELPNIPATEIDRSVARWIAPKVEDGACLQVGIGGMPNAVFALLRDSGVRDLGVHTEMLTDSIGELYTAGCLTGARKTLDPGKVVYTFALGSKALYDVIERNRDFLC